jgi:hypothetical protein
VTITKAVPRSRASCSISANTVSAVPRSRLPVGSSASTQAGMRDQRAGDRHPLALAAGEFGRAVAHALLQPDGREHVRACWCTTSSGSRRMRSGMPTLSSALNSGSRWWNW